MWQCGSGYKELTERVTLLALDFGSPFSSSQGKSIVRCALPTAYPRPPNTGLHTDGVQGLLAISAL